MGRAGLQTGDPGSTTVGSTTTTVFTALELEKVEYAALVNDSDETIYIAFGAPAVLNKGIRLNANGGSVVWESARIPLVDINSICATGGKNLCTHLGV